MKAIDELQMVFAIAIVDREDPPRLTHVYDIIERWMPRSLLQKAEPISKETAREKIVAKLLENKVVSNIKDTRRFFPFL